jgi:hypothetical protein
MSEKQRGITKEQWMEKCCGKQEVSEIFGKLFCSAQFRTQHKAKIDFRKFAKRKKRK